MTDDQHPPEPFVPHPAHDPADQPLPGEGADDMTDPKDNVPESGGDFGIPTKEPTPEPDYFADDEAITEAEISPTLTRTNRERRPAPVRTARA